MSTVELVNHRRIEAQRTTVPLDSITESLKPKASIQGKMVSDGFSALHTHLAELSFAAANDNSLSADVLQSLSDALSDGLSLSARCHNPNPPSGKLKTQNDINSLFAKIDRL
nr:vacuolar protein 8 [Ipomoea batatas]